MLTTLPVQIDARAFRATMGRFATGVTVISHTNAGEVHGMTANAFLSVSLDPPLILVSLGNMSRMGSRLAIGQMFGVSILAEDQIPLSNHFAGRPNPNTVIRWDWEADVPLLAGAVAHITACVVAIHAAGDHTLFIGQVEYLAQEDGRPLLFHAGSYAQLC